VRKICSTTLFALLLGSGASTLAAPEAEPRITVALGYAGSTVEADIGRDGEESLTLGGWGLRGRVNLNDSWGIQARYSVADDDWSGGELTLDRIDVLALRQWVSRSERHRLYYSFGLTRLSLEDRILAGGTVRDDAFGPAAGLGWEWGENRWAFSVDFVLSYADVTSGLGSEDWLVGATISGMTYRFGGRRRD
jgi:hypothetical protein